jgi:PAS domain S-box-containing protein
VSSPDETAEPGEARLIHVPPVGSDIDARTGELAVAHARLRSADDPLRQALSIQTVGVVFFTLDGRITDSNDAFERMSGYTREELRSLPHGQVLTDPAFMDATARAAEEVARCGETSPYEKQMIRKDGTRWWGLFAPRCLVPDVRDAECIEFVLDITDRRRAEQELRYRSEQFQQLLDHVPIGVYLVDNAFRIIQVNPVARLVFGDIPNLLGRNFGEVIHMLWDAPYADEIVGIFRHTLETGEPYITKERAELRIDRGVVEYYEWQLHRTPLPDDQTGVVCYFQDISEHVRARVAIAQAHDELEARVHQRTSELARVNAALEAELGQRRAVEEQIKALFRRIVTVQEEERRRLAYEIHDRLGQQMTALRISLEALRPTFGTRAPDGAAARVERLAEDLDRRIDFLTWQLRPAALDDLGLSVALRALVAGWSERFGIRAEYRAAGVDDLRMAPEVEASLYRLVQEALQNVSRHAGATRVTVAFERGDHAARLVVEDDGRGFSAHDLDRVPESSLGIASMRERATLAGGELQVRSSPGHGASIAVHIPLRTHTIP